MELMSEILIKAPISVVYQTAEQYPLFVSFFKERRILSQNENEMTVKVGYFVLGIPIRCTGHGVKERPKAIRFRQTEGPLKGLTANWLFESLGEGNATRVIIQSRLPFKIPVLDWWVKMIVRRNIKRILADLRETVESKYIPST